MEDTLIWARSIERNILVVGAFYCLWLAYKFQVANGDGSALVAWQGLKIELKKIGPSIFFALLATVIIIASITSDLKISEEGSSRKLQYFTEAERNRVINSVSQINAKIKSLAGYSGSLQQNNLTPQEKDNLAKTIKDLQEMRSDLFDAAFGPGTRTKFSNLIQRCPEINSQECQNLNSQFPKEILEKMRSF